MNLYRFKEIATVKHIVLAQNLQTELTGSQMGIRTKCNLLLLCKLIYRLFDSNVSELCLHLKNFDLRGDKLKTSPEQVNHNVCRYFYSSFETLKQLTLSGSNHIQIKNLKNRLDHKKAWEVISINTWNQMAEMQPAIMKFTASLLKSVFTAILRLDFVIRSLLSGLLLNSLCTVCHNALCLLNRINSI